MEWRRGFSVSPPALNPSDPRHPRFDGRYRGLSPDILPATESLEKTMRRVLEVWDERILPRLRMRKRILIVAHGNTLRALIKHLEGSGRRDLGSQHPHRHSAGLRAEPRDRGRDAVLPGR